MVAGIVKLFPWHAEKGFEAFGTLHDSTTIQSYHPNFLWLVHWWLQGDDIPKFTNNYLYIREVTWCVLVCKVKKKTWNPVFVADLSILRSHLGQSVFFWRNVIEITSGAGTKRTSNIAVRLLVPVQACGRILVWTLSRGLSKLEPCVHESFIGFQLHP